MDVTELKETQLELQRAIRMRDEFMSIASHELKTPLTSLKLLLELMPRTFDELGMKQSTEKGQRLTRMLEICSTEVNALAELVNDLLDTTRVSEGKLRLEPRRLDLGELCRATMERFAGDLAPGMSQVSLEVAGPPIVGVWDRKRIEQVVINLLTNAMKYGGGKPIRISVGPGPLGARLIVRDQGIGIPGHKLSCIFERFERAEQEGSGSVAGGLGLGLYIVKQLVQAHRGQIHVESEPGRGSTFTVDLPLEAGTDNALQ